MTGCDWFACSIQPLAPPILFFKDKRKAPNGLRPSIATKYSMGGPSFGERVEELAFSIGGGRPPYTATQLRLPQLDQPTQGLLCGFVGGNKRGGASLVGHGCIFFPAIDNY